MNITSLARADQLVPMSKARASLPSLVEKLGDIEFFVLVKKYQPKAALVDLKFLAKLLEKYKHWQRERDFAELEGLMNSMPTFDSDEIEKDILNAVKAVRYSN